MGIGAAGLTAVDGDLIALAVGVGAAAEFLAQGGEVVQHVEGADGVLALDVIDGVELGRAGVLPRDGQVCALGVAGDRGGGLEAPLLMREAHDDRVLESHGIGGAQGLDGLGIILGDVRQRGILVGLEIVAGAAVIQGDQLIGVVLGELLDIGVGIGGGGEDIGRLAEGFLARGEADLAVLVERVVIGHGVLAGLDEHVLEGLAGLVAIGKLVHLEWGDLLQRGIELLDRGGVDLSGIVELGDLAGYLDGIFQGWVLVGRLITHVDKDGLGSIGGLGAGATSLDGEAIKAAFGPHAGDDALGGNGLILERGFGAGALDIRDGGDALGGRLFGLCRLLRLRGGGLVTGVGRGRGAAGEIGGVVIAIGALRVAGGGLGIGQARGGGAFLEGSGAVADGIDGGTGGVGKLHGALGAGHVEAALGIWGRQGLARAIAGRALHQEVAVRGNGAGKLHLAAGIAGGGEVLHGVSGQVNRGIGGVIELDEVMGEGSALIAASPVDLGDDGSGAIGCGRGGRNGKGGRRQGGGKCQRAEAARRHRFNLKKRATVCVVY